MKNLYFLLLLSISSTLNGQTIDHFSNSDSKWYVADSYIKSNPQNPSFIETKTTTYGYQGDSLIGADTWLKLYSTTDSLFITNLQFEGFYRSINNMVLHRVSNSIIDTVYNFNLNIGDSAFIDFTMNPEYLKVISIDSVLINGVFYKQFHFSEPTGMNTFTSVSEKWIKGIGSVHGPLFPRNPRKFSSEHPDSLFLTCSHSLSSLQWENASYSQCVVNILLGTNDIPVQNFSVYPNPFQEKISIQLTNNQNATVEVFNLLGVRLINESIYNKQKQLDLSTLPNGVYIVTVSFENSKETIRVIKE
jgi:hypothetical protein